MAVTYVIQFDVVPAQIDRFRRLLHGVLDAMRSEPNFRNAVLHCDPDSEHRFMLYETWHSHEDVLRVQLQRPYRQQWHEALAELLDGPRAISVWKPLREWKPIRADRTLSD
jgi:quinol monooxygenase YgiN